MAVVAAFLRLQGISVYPYIDDWLLVSTSDSLPLRFTGQCFQVSIDSCTVPPLHQGLHRYHVLPRLSSRVPRKHPQSSRGYFLLTTNAIGTAHYVPSRPHRRNYFRGPLRMLSDAMPPVLVPESLRSTCSIVT